MYRSLATIAALLAVTIVLPADDAVESLKSWTTFGNVTLGELATGKVATSVNASMNLDRGMSTQALFVVDAPVAKTQQALLEFNATRHPELSVFQHHVFQGEKDASFDKLQLDPKTPPSLALISTMGDAGVMQLSKAEIALTPKAPSAAEAEKFLADILKERWSRFALTGDMGSVGTFDAASEIRSLLGEEPKVATHFSSLLAPTKVKGAPGTPRFFYWDLSNVDKKSAVQLGAVYASETSDRKQVLDITWFSSGGYLVSIALYELLPVTLNGREHTLVWQGSLVSATGLAGGLGLKRKIGSRMMLSQVEKWVGIFRQDAEKAGR